MYSFLVELDNNYELFEATNGEIIKLYHFPDEIKECFTHLLMKANKFYYDTCKRNGLEINDFEIIKLEKDKSGKCFLKVVGIENHTVLIIRRNDSNIDDYKNIMGYKMTEEEFKTILDFRQQEKLKWAAERVPKRFFKGSRILLS